MAKRGISTARLGRPRKSDRPTGAPSTRQRLLNAASDLFAEKGYQAASMDAIAERADLTVGSIYRHFAGKAELLLDVVNQQLEALPFRFESAVDPDSLVGAATAYIEPEAQKMRRLAVEMLAVATRDERVASAILANNVRGTERIRNAIELEVQRGDIDSDLDASYAAQLVLILLMGLTHVDICDQSIVTTDRWHEFLNDAIMRMLKVRDTR